MRDMTGQDVLLTPFGAFFEVQVPFIPGHVEKGEKSKHFSYPDYFTYPDSQHWRLGQRCPDNRGSTVVVTFRPSCLNVKKGFRQTCRVPEECKVVYTVHYLSPVYT